MLEYYLYSKHCTRQQLHKTTVARCNKKATKPEREPSPIESLFVFVGFFGL